MECAEHDEAHEVCEELVVASCGTAKVHKFVEEPFDEIAPLVEAVVMSLRPIVVRSW